MLVNDSRLTNVPILSLQAGGAIAWTSDPIIDPDNLKILGFHLHGPLVDRSEENILDIKSVREYSRYGMVVDSIDEFVTGEDVIKIKKVLGLKFKLIGLKAETKKGSKLGKVIGFTATDDDFTIQQLIIQRPTLKALIDPELIIPRKEIAEINDYKVIIKDEEKKIAEKASTEFVPNFTNPFKNGSFVGQDNTKTQ